MACRVPILDHVLGQVFFFGWFGRQSYPNLLWIFYLGQRKQHHSPAIIVSVSCIFHLYTRTWPSVGLVQHGLVATKTQVAQTGPNKKVLPSLISVFFLTFQFFSTTKSHATQRIPPPSKGSFKLENPPAFFQTSGCDTTPRTSMSSVQNPGWLFDIGDYTTQLYGDYNKPI